MATPSVSTTTTGYAPRTGEVPMASPDPQQAGSRPTRHPLVAKILAADAPEAIRMTAARGALPIPLQDLVYAQVCLLSDPLPQVVEAAGESLSKTTEDSLLALLGDAGCDPLVIDHFAKAGTLAGAALEAAVAHPAIMDGTLEALAASAPAGTLDLIVTNEVRIIKNPHLLDVLRANSNLSTDNRRRLNELERDFVGKEQLKVRQAPAPEAAGAPEEPVVAEGEGTAA